MRNWLQKLMYGRYGFDSLSQFILILLFIFAFINIFVNSIIIYIISLIPMVIFIFRFFSKNKTKRIAENNKFNKIKNKIFSWFKFQWQKIREIKTHRYIKCPQCKATLRVPRKLGEHTAVCPKCKNRFETKIII